MEPTLLVGDHILVNKFIYGLRVPFTDARWPRFKDRNGGDVIVFIYPEDRTKDFIKRVVGIGGDTVEIRNKKVFINGQRPSSRMRISSESNPAWRFESAGQHGSAQGAGRPSFRDGRQPGLQPRQPFLGIRPC